MSSMQEIFGPAPEPKTALGRRRILSPTCGLRVSPLCLGGMSLGEQWGGVTGKITKDDAFRLLDAFVEAGGNFIDTANLYHYGDSERWIGEWMKSRDNRDQMVIATKYSGFNDGTSKDANSSGNQLKSMSLTVRESLKRLQTSYIDIFYVHVWDHTTSVEEIMRGLHRHVLSGEILYPAVSDTPAWVVMKANCFAREKGMSPFVLYQGRWSLGIRDFERDIIPMCRDQGMGLAPWGAIGQGKWMSQAKLDEREKNGEKLRGEREESDVKISNALEKVGNEVGASITAVALAYVMSKTPYVFPIVGGRKIEHLHDNIKALTVSLSDEQVKQLEEVAAFDPGFPHTMINVDPHWQSHPGSVLLPATARYDWVQSMVPIKP